MKHQHAKIQQLRTALIAIEKAMGQPISAIAERYKLRPETVKQHLTLAEESGFIDQYTQLVRDSCIPQAIAVYEAHLKLGNLEAARDILFGLGVLSRHPKERQQQTETFEDYKQQLKERLNATFRERPH